MIKVFQIVNKLFNSNTFIVYRDDEDGVWLMDCGDADKVLEWCRVNGKTVKGILVTHSHFDHIYGCNTILERFQDIKVYVGAGDKNALFSAKMNMSRYHEEPDFVYFGENVCVVEEGSRILLWDDGESICVESISVPGHTPGCICYKIENYLFTGDAYIPGHEVVTQLPRADKGKAAESKMRIESILTDITLCPGHEEIKIF